ncbi:Trypanosoma vivax, partial [Trypanosoma theileri]
MSFFFNEDVDDEPMKKRRHMEQEQEQQRQKQQNQGFLYNRKEGKEDEDDEEDDRPVLTNPAASGGGRVGLKLLQDMHNAPSCSSSSIPISTVVEPQKLRVVEDYTPLSVGGFMGTSAETILNSAHNVRPGDIMCLRCPPPTMTRHLAVNSVSPVDIVAAAPSASSSSGSSSTAGMQFVKETDLTEEEKLYGKRLSCDMLRELFEVGRVDSATN